MLSHIIRYDWLLLRTNRTLPVSGLLLVFFVAFALWTGHRHARFARQTVREIQQADQQNIASLRQQVRDIEQGKPYAGTPWTNPTSVFAVGNSKGARYATLPPEPLALTSLGQSDLEAYYYKVTMTKPQALYHGQEISNATALYNGHFDLSFVVVYLLPLLIIALTYNVIAAEKEQGTLSLVLSVEAPFQQVVLSKYGFRFVLLNAAFAGITTAGLLLAGVDLAAVSGRVVFLFGIVLLYTLFWFALSFAVNSYGKNSGFNAATLVGIWLVLVLLAPALLSVSAAALHPTPSRVALVTQTREASEAVKKEGSKLLSRYYEDHPELLPKGQPVDSTNFSLLYMRTQLAVEEAIRPAEARFERQLAKQQQLVRNYRFLSPAVFMQQSLNQAAGTGESRYVDFKKQVWAYYRTFQSYFARKVFRKETMTPADVDHIPAFRYQAPPPGLLSLPALLNGLFLLLVSGMLVVLGLSQSRKVQLAVV